MEIILNFRWIKKILKLHNQHATSADSAVKFKWGPKVEESQIIGMESNFVFLQRPKPKFVNITGTKKGISPLMFAYMICP